MDIKGHRQCPRGYHRKMNRERMDKQFKETRDEFDKLMLRIHKKSKEEGGMSGL
jgi:hypothetical protein